MKKLIVSILLISILVGCIPSIPSTQATPWWRDAVFYEIFVRSFYDTNGNGIGDFNGITQKLDYLQQLGINAIWLMPIHPSPSYHGYDVLDYYAVNPDYGTMDDFKHLLGEAHQRNIHIIIDLVLNHTSDQHPFFKEASSDPNSKYHGWYIWSDTDQGKGWHLASGTKPMYYFGQFCDCMPDLNYRNAAVTKEMENVVKYWLDDIGVDGFRVDAAKHLIEEGQQVENTKATHEWFKGFYQAYKADNPRAFAVGEVFGADASLAKAYTGNQLDEIFNFEVANSILNSVNGGSNIAITSALTFAQQSLPDGEYATFLTNHDQNRTMTVLNADLNKAKLAAFLLLTSPGVPFIYYGEEIGMQGEKPDEDIRLPMQWSTDANAGFTTGTPWRAPSQDYRTVNVAAQATATNSLLNHYRALIKLRQNQPALSTGKSITLQTGNPGVYAILRMDNRETMLVLANLTNNSIYDFALSLSDKVLMDGIYKAEVLFESGPVEGGALSASKGPQVIGGNFQNYKPIKELSPYSTLIVKFSP